jgi:glycosyltransferase involved in cell wall biosynthesis
VNQTSYGYVGSYLIRGLSRLGVDIRYIPIGGVSPDRTLLDEILPSLKRWDYDYKAPCVRIWHQHDLNPFYGKGSRIGLPIFELERFTDVESHSLRNPDDLIVCSEWAKSVIIENIPDRVNSTHVVPLGYCSDIFKPCDMPFGTTIFGNFGKFEKRKGHDVLWKIFNAAFEKEDDVALVMMPHNFFLDEEEHAQWVNKYRNSKLGKKIYFVNRVQHHAEVYGIMKGIHCGIFPSRAEGWNLEALELLACGKHLIITDCTAHTEFCNQDNSMLVKMSDEREPALDDKFFNGDFEWRTIGQDQIEQMVNYLRLVHKQQKEGSLRPNSAGIDSVKKFEWGNVSQIFVDTIKRIS